MSPREVANIHPEKHNILVFLSNTLFSPFYVPFPSLFPISKNGRYLGGTWEEQQSFLFVYLHHFESRDSAIGGHVCIDTVFYVLNGCVSLHFFVGIEGDGIILFAVSVGGF